MTAAIIVVLVLAGASLTLVAVSYLLQARAIRRALPLAHRYLVTHHEGTVLEIAEWITEHDHPVHHGAGSEALRELERDVKATSRLQETDLPPERQGHPRRVYKLASDPAVTAAVQRMIETADRVEATAKAAS